MSSRLELVPFDVLEQIAYFTVDSAPLTKLDNLLHLIFSSRTLYNSLSIRACPRLYANVFRVTFDLPAYHRRAGGHAETATCLAMELKRRRETLRRIHLHQVDGEDLLSDLWTVYLMLVESDALNEMHLHTVGVADWIVSVLVRLFQPSRGSDDQTVSLAIAVAALALSHDDISRSRAEDRERILHSIRPFTAFRQRRSWVDAVPRYKPSQGSCEHIAYTYGQMMPAPNLSTTSIFLTFVLNEVTPPQLPPQSYPATRAEAEAAGVDGPTMEDFLAVTGRRTPLVADSFHQSQCRESVPDLPSEHERPSRSAAHDEDFYRIIRHLDISTHAQELRAYLPGLLTGVWEGNYMVAQSTSGAHPLGIEGYQEFLCRHPIQFRLAEYLSFTPSLPLPIGPQHGFDGWNFFVRHGVSSNASGGDHDIEPFRLNGDSDSGRDPRQALDVVIIGETPRRFQAAWGAHDFVGQVRLSDGLISLTRRPSAGDHGSGVWVFEGYLHTRRTLAGRWSSFGSTDGPGVGGIFSVSKTAAD